MLKPRQLIDSLSLSRHLLISTVKKKKRERKKGLKRATKLPASVIEFILCSFLFSFFVLFFFFFKQKVWRIRIKKQKKKKKKWEKASAWQHRKIRQSHMCFYRLLLFPPLSLFPVSEWFSFLIFHTFSLSFSTRSFQNEKKKKENRRYQDSCAYRRLTLSRL